MTATAQPIPCICMRTGCTMRATHYPKMRVPAKLFMRAAFPEPLSLVIGLKLCLEHVAFFDGKEAVTKNPKHFAAVFNALSGNGDFPLDVDAIYVEPLPIDSEEAQKFEAMTMKKSLTGLKPVVH